MVKTNNNNDIIAKAILGSGYGNEFKSLRDVLTFEVSVKPITKEGSPLSYAELNKARIGNGLGQIANSTYGVEATKKAKPSKRKASKTSEVASDE